MYRYHKKIMYKYFSDKEVERLAPTLAVRLDNARECSGIPFIITSGYRSKEKNAEVGGSPDSAHLRGLAVDIRCRDDKERYAIIAGLYMAGFTRIGIGKGHIHADIDPDKTNRILFIE